MTHPLFFQKNFMHENHPNMKTLRGVRRSLRESTRSVGLTGPRKIGYIAEVVGEKTEQVGLCDECGLRLTDSNDSRVLSSFSDTPLGLVPRWRRRNKQQRSDIDRKCSVSRMARPQRGTYRFMEEPAPALSIDPEQRRAPHVWRPAILIARAVETRSLP
jgi:hypothetical protein